MKQSNMSNHPSRYQKIGRIKQRQIGHLKPSQSKTVTFEVTVPSDEEYFHPYDEPYCKVQLV